LHPGHPPLLLRLIPVGFILVGLSLFAEGVSALGGGSLVLCFLRQEVSQGELVFLLLPRIALLLGGGAYLGWALERRPHLFREVVVGMSACLFLITMAGACLVGHRPFEAWLDAGWPPFVTGLALGTLLYGSGSCARYLEQWSRPRFSGAKSPA
jgi:hypothetical protein